MSATRQPASWAVLALAIACSAVPVSAASWSDAVSSETDTVLFLGSHGELLRAPFHLATRETLWSPANDERVVRVSVRPSGHHVAWLTRGGDRTATTLWVNDDSGTHRLAAFVGLVPSDYNEVRFESVMPSVADPEITGERWLVPGSSTRSRSSNALAWTWDGGALLLGYRDGLARVEVDSGSVKVMSQALAMGLRRLDPAPMLLAEVIRLGKGSLGDMVASSPELSRDATGRARGEEDLPGERSGTPRVAAQAGSYLVYPVSHDLRVFAAPDLASSDPWTASPGTMWWVEGKRRLRAARANDPRTTLEQESHDPIVWLEYDAGRGALLRASGRAVVSRSEAGGVEATLIATGQTITAVLAVPASNMRAIVTRDSLLLWDTSAAITRGLALNGIEPTQLLRVADGTCVVVESGEHHAVPALYRVDLEAGRLVSLEAPAVRGGRVSAGPGGHTLVLAAAGARPPSSIEVYEAVSRRWSQVPNPGIVGWELLFPR